VQVGDLVKCLSTNCVIGLIVSIKPNVHSAVTKRSIFNVLLDGDIYPFRSDMLEVISASR
jgi:hypothetical protein